MRVLALDVGTSSVKAAVLDVASATAVGEMARVAYALDYPTSDAAEVPPERLWAAVAAAARQAARGIAGIEGVGLSTLTPALVLLDKTDQPLAPIWTHLDRRSRPIARRVWDNVGERFLAATGNRPLPGGITAICYRQLVESDPTLGRRIAGYLHANGWLALRMTGEKAFDRGNACFTGLYGTLTDQDWSAEWCDYFQVERAWLPPVVCGSNTLGPLRSEAAADLGVPAGLPVKLGTADTSSAMLYAGMGPGDVLHVVGTTQVLACLTDRPIPSPERLTRQLGVGTAFIHVTHNPVGGAALGWLRELCFRDQTDQEFYEQTIARAEVRETSVILDPPFLGGDRLEIEARRAAFREITLSTDRLDLLAAVLQAMRLHHRRAFAALGMVRPVNRFFLTGGGAEVVRKLLPEYAATPVSMVEEGSLRGVARLFASR